MSFDNFGYIVDHNILMLKDGGDTLIYGGLGAQWWKNLKFFFTVA